MDASSLHLILSLHLNVKVQTSHFLILSAHSFAIFKQKSFAMQCNRCCDNNNFAKLSISVGFALLLG